MGDKKTIQTFMPVLNQMEKNKKNYRRKNSCRHNLLILPKFCLKLAGKN
jgi:hypothetical protein